jgi:hypothetical protein
MAKHSIYDEPVKLPRVNWNPFEDEPVRDQLAKDKIKFFGWIPPELRTSAQQKADEKFVAAAPEFRIAGSFKDDKRKVALYEALRKIQGGEDRYIWQTTGSCVGAGGGNATMTVAAVEIVQNGEPEEWKPLWWLYTYGESREIAGMRNRGSGSFCSAWAKAASTKGTFEADQPGLPKFTMKGGWYWLSGSTELEWSDGRQSPAKWDEIARKHLVKTVAKAKNADDVIAGIKNGYPSSSASMFGTRGTKVFGSGENAVHIAEWDDSWAHNMFFDAWWDHPTEGELVRNGNNWGPNAHGKAADGSPIGGFWLRKRTVDRICQDDVWVLSQYDGFPAQSLDWNPFD